MGENMIKETWEQLKSWVQNTLDIEKRLRTHAPALHRRLFKNKPKLAPPPAPAAASHLPAKTKPAALEDRKGKSRKGARPSSSTSSSSSSTSSSSVWNRARGPKPVSAFSAAQV